MGDRHYGGSKASSSANVTAKQRGIAGGDESTSNGLTLPGHGASTSSSYLSHNQGASVSGNSPSNSASMMDIAYEYPNKKKATLASTERSMTSHPTSGGVQESLSSAHLSAASLTTSAQDSVRSISGVAPSNSVSSLSGPQSHTSSISTSKSASRTTLLDNTSSSALSSEFEVEKRTSLLAKAKSASLANASLQTASVTSLVEEEQGSVMFSFGKPTKPIGVAQSSLTKLKSAPILPILPPAATTSVHKPGGHIAFFKPTVTPKKSGLISSYRARRDEDDDEEEAAAAPPPAPVEPEKPVEVPTPALKSTTELKPNTKTQPPQTEPRRTLQDHSRSSGLESLSIAPPAAAPKAATLAVKKPVPGPPTYGMRTLDSYKIVHEISEGTYGVVYRAIDTYTGDIVALKRVKVDPAKEKDTGFPVSSIREIRALAYLRNENVVSLRDIISDDSGSTIYLVMDYIPHDLHQMLKNHLKESVGGLASSTTAVPSLAPPAPMEPLFSVGNAKSLMHQLFTSMAFMHSKNFMHRDIKSSNLLVSDEGKLYLADFGLAKEWTTAGQSQRTPTVVTITYRAPELAFGAPDYGVAVDMWSVGLVMAEILTGKELMRGVKSELELMSRLVEIFGSPNESNYGKGFDQLAVNSPKATLVLKQQPDNKLRAIFPQLSRLGFDLLSGLLCYDPEKRLTAEQCLEHPWFKEMPPPVQPNLAKPAPAPQAPKQPPPPSHYQSQQQPPPPSAYYQPANAFQTAFPSQRPTQEPYNYNNQPPPFYGRPDRNFAPPPQHYHPNAGPHVPYTDPYHQNNQNNNTQAPYGRYPPQQDPRWSSQRRSEYR